jgi:hypothetical protein
MDPLLAAEAVKAVGGAVSGAAKAVGSLFGGGARRREQRRAKAELGQMKEKYNQLDTSNPYANISNPYQNLTVNTQAADFAAQQTSQNSANIMSGLAAAAGGSGIAALAQSMANSQAQQTQQASASIAQQESKNQVMAAQGENQRQIAVAKGEESSRQMEADKVGTQMGMAQSRLTAANEARAAAKADLVGGLSDMAGGAAQAFAGTAAGTDFLKEQVGPGKT